MDNILRRGAGLLGLVLAAQLACADTTAEIDPVQAEFDAAFEAMLLKPADVDTVLRYSRAATNAGDYESAIGALERLLLINSNMPVVRADLGLLYYRLESYAVALSHLNQVMPDLDELPQNLQDSVRNTIGRLDKKIARSSFNGSLSLGLRYQDNANAGPESETVLAAGVPTTLNTTFRQQDDFNSSIYGRIQHRYDLRTQNGAAVLTDATVYATHYADLSRLNSLMFSISPGIQFKPDPGDHKGFTLKPHLLARVIYIDDERFSDSLGAGVDGRYRIREDLTVDGRVQWRTRDYNQSATRTTLNQRDGHEWAGRMRVHTRFGAHNVLFSAGVTDRTAARNFRSSRSYDLLGRVAREHAAPFGSAERWLTSFSLAYRDTEYDAPDPAVDPNRARDENRWRAALSTFVPIADAWSLRAGVSYSTTDANIPNYERDNTAVDLNAIWRF